MKIVNIVCSGSMNQKISFSALLSLDSSLFCYDPEMYHGAYLLANSKKITLYTSGKYIFTGLKAIDEIDSLFLKMKSILDPFVDPQKIGSPIIQNIVFIDKLETPINIVKFEKIAKKNIRKGIRKKNPGIIFKTKNGTALIFKSGKIVILGVKTLKVAESLKKEIMKCFQ